ncbi:MAG TPA: hypothetical protein VJJ81_03920 [Candidatus Babeliales bacterium]|nr:hypothetical protein [Candidatus Babeliales bacterium]
MFGINFSANDVNHSAGMGWVDQFKTKLDSGLTSLNITTSVVVQLVTVMGVGFFVGFLFKKYSRVALAALIIFILGVFALESFNLVLIQWFHVKSLIGITGSTTVGVLFDTYVLWIKTHLLAVISGFFGFFMGYRVA